MPRSLSDDFEAIASRILASDRVSLLCDFDGTLVPIHEHPAQCFLDASLRSLLASLAAHRRMSVGIVSGRQLHDLKHRVGIEGIAYVGNHGLEFDAPDLDDFEPVAREKQEAVRRTVTDLKAAIAPISGAWIEDKGLSASVHYRQVEPGAVAALIDLIRIGTLQFVMEGKIVLRPGKMVVEVRPAVAWNKGTAVQRLADRFPSTLRTALIYLGDDETDEDVFRTRRDDITICVGDRAATAANYRVSGPSEVDGLIRRLANIILPGDVAGAAEIDSNTTDARGSR